jgi:2-methylcitrate dehydratase PrpD
VKRIHSAIPTAAGVRAALFAAAGITGPHSILEGEKGFCKVFAVDYDLKRLTDGLGTHYHLLDNAIKPYSCCHLIHAAFDALDQLRDRETFSPEDIDRILVYTNSEQILSHIGSIIEPQDILGAQFSLPFSLAMRLHHGGRGVNGGNGFWDYPKVDVKDPTLVNTARKVKCQVADKSEWSAVDKGAGIEVILKNGRHLTEIVPYSKGLPENPLSKSELEEKFHSLVDPILPAGRPKEIIDAVSEIEKVRKASDLIQLLVVPPGKRFAAVAGWKQR